MKVALFDIYGNKYALETQGDGQLTIRLDSSEENGARIELDQTGADLLSDYIQRFIVSGAL